MEAARLGLGDYPLSSLGRSPPGTSANQPAMAGLLGAAASNQAALSLMDPWLAASPLLGSTLSHALPGFLAHPQTCYPSYLTPPTSAASLFSSNPHHPPPHHTTLIEPRSGVKLTSPLTALGPHTLSPVHTPTSIGGGGGSPVNSESSPGLVGRSSSIAALRMKAKEHLESLSKGIQIT